MNHTATECKQGGHDQQRCPGSQDGSGERLIDTAIDNLYSKIDTKKDFQKFQLKHNLDGM